MHGWRVNDAGSPFQRAATTDQLSWSLRRASEPTTHRPCSPSLMVLLVQEASRCEPTRKRAPPSNKCTFKIVNVRWKMGAKDSGQRTHREPKLAGARGRHKDVHQASCVTSLGDRRTQKFGLRTEFSPSCNARYRSKPKRFVLQSLSRTPN